MTPKTVNVAVIMVYFWAGQPKKASQTFFAANSSFLCRFIDIILIYDNFLSYRP